ncbi:MAG TPA: cation:proton antiporter [Herpetosiphonaceae bacterium]|nr:cation:proton antiporter [Herpetosiphonaceae bacterium]
MSNFELALKLFLQMAVILGVCRLISLLGRRYLGQTEVVCEMIAGVLLGPSLFGLLAPAAKDWLFPSARLALAGGATIPNPSMSIIFAISQIGVVVYMFLIGLEFNTELIRGRMRSAGLVSGAGILVPFVLGGGAALLISDNGALFSPGISPWAAAIYLGASMSITAFPMLARMLHERGIAKTQLGTLALAAGSMDDAVAWCLLAVVLASIQAQIGIAVLAIGGGIAYVALMIAVGRPLFKRIFEGRMRRDGGRVTMQTLTLLMAVVMFCAWFTDVIGIYAIFGGFIAGTVMPRGAFAEQVRERTEHLATAFLVPTFFVFSGLNTQLGLVNTPALWGITLLVIVIAVAGKGLACALAARAAGESWRDSATVGTLMNARGLMELIILNIGLEKGIITPTLFTMMVIMAITTTLMTSPLFNLIYKDSGFRSQKSEGRRQELAKE